MRKENTMKTFNIGTEDGRKNQSGQAVTNEAVLRRVAENFTIVLRRRGNCI